MIADKPAEVDKRPAPVQSDEATPSRKSRALASWFGVLLFIYAALHAAPGMAAVAHSSMQFVRWAATFGWFVTAGSLALAAYGLWGFPGLARRWRGLALLGVGASLALLMATGQWSMWPLMVVDGLIASIAIDSNAVQIPKKKRGIFRWTGLQLARLLAIAVWVYGAAVIVVRPWQQHWGATDAEIAKLLPGDHPGTRANLIDHVVTVNAPPERVWPWLMQLGQDKAGFYSYDWLERAIGAKVHNVYEVRPEWQHLQVGDFIRACPPDWLGGRWKDSTGWRVTQVQPGRLLVLENWGPFWLEPTPEGKTRLGVRSEIGNMPFWAAPIEVFGFEPAHFIMEQKMLRTIKGLAERPQ